MMKTNWIAACGMLLFAGMTAAMMPGPAQAKGSEWQMTTTMEIPGMPFAMPPTTVRQCLEENAVPYHENEDQKCQVVSQKRSGNTLTWKVVCNSPEGKSEMTGVTTYTGDTMDTKMQMQGGEQEGMSIHTVGKKLGPCK